MKKRLEVTKKYIPELKVIQVEQKTTIKGKGSFSLIEFKRPTTADEKIKEGEALVSIFADAYDRYINLDTEAAQ